MVAAGIGLSPPPPPLFTGTGSDRFVDFRNRFYYLLKPLLPRRLRTSLRRAHVAAVRRRNGHAWPIDPAAGTPPAGWQGWPAGRKFAFVLTHDVEGPVGLDRVRPLAELEIECGFRSSFNFIPEGEYAVPPGLRHWLRERGFEVGVHDFHHDGKLFDSRRGFLRKAAEINRYLHDWQAVGFRAGFMLRKLDWYHDLNIRYDASTFDTDPFEPQPEGARTIFPFWQGAPGRPGYVELPYTLPQDSTLFLYCCEPGPEIWLRKLDWIAEHGGMALVNVHPDYLAFGPAAPASSFDPGHYRRLLQYVRDRYAATAWPALPGEVALFFARQYGHDVR